jgi:hypothetical protein
MPTYRVCPPASAKGLTHAKVKAAYGMGVTRTTIAACDQQFKPLGIAPAPWMYRPGKAGQGLVKANQRKD